MIFLAQELKRNNIDIPLMIGGATTSKAHTAVKIHPEIDSGLVHVKDASSAVVVANKIIGNKSDLYFNEINSEYNEIRNGFLERKQQKEYITINDARNNKFKIDWKNEKISKPIFWVLKSLII